MKGEEKRTFYFAYEGYVPECPNRLHRAGWQWRRNRFCVPLAFLCASAIRLVRGILIAVIDVAFSLEGPFVRLRPQETWLTLRT